MADEAETAFMALLEGSEDVRRQSAAQCVVDLDSRAVAQLPAVKDDPSSTLSMSHLLDHFGREHSQILHTLGVSLSSLSAGYAGRDLRSLAFKLDTD